MTMQVNGRAKTKRRTLAQVGVKVFGIGLLIAFVPHAWTEPIETPSQALELEQVQKKVRQISGQLLQLRQLTMKSGKDQQDFSKSIKQELENLALRQTQLKQELAELEVSGQQQIEQLQKSHQRLRWAFGATVALLILTLGWLAQIWRARQTWQSDQVVQASPANPNRVDIATPEPTAAGTSTEAESIVQTDASWREVMANDEVPTEAVMQTPPAQPTNFSESEQPRETASWAALVAADLQSTQMAMAQARQDFMRTPRIQP